MYQKFFGDVLPRSAGVVVLADGFGGPRTQRIAEDHITVLERVVYALECEDRDFYFTPARYHMGPGVDENDGYKGLRTAANCVAKRCYVVDVDLNHATKPSYATKPEGAAAMLALIESMGLPPFTYCVDSGRGLHYYWCFDEDIPAARWLAMADALKPKLLAADPKLFCDPTRLADLAGYFRLPGSWNTKSSSLVGLYADAQDVCAFTAFETVADAAARHSPLAGILPAVRAGAPVRRASDTPVEPTVPDPSALLRRCVPLAHLKDNPATQGYEAWFGVARLLARSASADAGRVAFRAFSEGHAGYSPADADRKFDDALANTQHSPSCAQMRTWAGVQDSACAACPMYKAHKNGKPAALQAEHPIMSLTAAVSPADDNEAAHFDKIRRAKSGQFVPMGMLGLPDPAVGRVGNLTIDSDGSLKAIVPDSGTGDKADTVTMDAASGPIWVQAKVREQDPAGRWVYNARIAIGRRRSPDSDWEMLTTLVDSDSFVDRGRLYHALRKAGFGIRANDANEKSWRAVYAHLSAQANIIQPEDSTNSVGRCGWFDLDQPTIRSFVVGDRQYAVKGTSLVELTTDAMQHTKDLTQKGTLEGAKSLFGLMTKEMTPTGHLVLLAALGAPLMHMTPVHGAVVYMSGSTGVGKTMTLSYLQSFYGGPGGMARGKDTSNSIMHSLGNRSAIPFCLDEATSMTRPELGKILMTVTDGRERARMQSDTNSLRATNEWSTILFASSNNKLDSAGYTAEGEAQMARTIVVNADHNPMYVGVLPSPLVAATTQYHGTLGAAFIRHVLDNYDAVKARVDHYDRILRTTDGPLGASRGGDKFRVWRAVATVILATAELLGAAPAPIPNIGFFPMTSGNFLATLAGRLSSMADAHEAAVDNAPTSGGTADPAQKTNHRAVGDFVEWLNQQGLLSVYCIKDHAGGELTGEALIAAISKTNLVHVPYRNEAAQLHIQIGQPSVEMAFSSSSMRAWAQAVSTPDRRIDATHVMTSLGQRGDLITDNPPMSRHVQLRGDRDAVSSVSGNVLSRRDTVWVRIHMRAPVKDDMVLDWA